MGERLITLRRLLGGAIAVVWLTPCLFAQRPTVAAALDRYASNHGLIDLRVLIGSDLDAGAERLTSEADRWIRTGDSGDRQRRQVIAAAFAIEELWPAVRWQFIPDPQTPPPRFPLRPETRAIVTVTAWACPLMKSAPADVARAWYRATIALLESSHQWVPLEGHGYPPASDLHMQRADVMREFGEGHLWHAKARFPDEPRWRLEPVLKMEAEAFAIMRLAELQLRGEEGALRTDRISPDWFRVATSRTQRGPGLERQLADLDRAVAALLDDPDPSLRAEAALRSAYWRLCRDDWTGALERLESLAGQTIDPYVRYMAAYFEGWAEEHLDRRADAIKAYRRATAIQANGQSLSALLAAQLFLDGDRAEAYQVLEGAFGRPPAILDPWLLFKLGDVRLIDGALAQMRERLP